MPFWEQLLRLFSQLPDWMKLVVFLVVFLIVVALSVLGIIGRRSIRTLRKELRRREQQAQQLAKERDELQKRRAAGCA